MIGFLVVSIVFLFIAEVALGFFWHSVLFRKYLEKTMKIKAGKEDFKPPRGVMKLQFLLILAKSVWATFIILILPKSFAALIVVALYVLVFPFILYGENIWTKEKSMPQLWIDSIYLMIAYAVTFGLAFILKLWLI